MHQNTRMTLLFYGLAGFASALVDTVSSNLLFALTSDNLKIGLNEGIQGVVQLLIAVPAGRYADAHADRQPACVRRSALLGMGTNALLMLVLLAILLHYQTEELQFWALAASLTLSGMVVGSYEPFLEALWSNALANGEERTRFNSTRSTIWQLAGLAGPCTSLLVFAVSESDWDVPTMCLLWMLGALCACLSFLPLTRLRCTAPLLVPLLEPVLEQPKAVVNWIPKCCLISNVLVALGSGATVKFWNVFFEEVVHFTPVEVNGILIAESLALAALLQLSNLVRPFVGRLRLALLQFALGMIMQGIIAFVGATWQHKWVVATLVVLRFALLNATSPAIAAILTDQVSETRRGIWAAMDSITVAGWCGSAVVGGWLADAYGFGPAFALTLGMHLTGFMCLLPVLRHET